MPLREWIRSTNNAIEGVLIAAKTEKHLRYHLYAAALVLLFSYSVGVTRTEFLIISITALIVIMVEMVNTAIEAAVNLLSPKKNELAKIAKDVAAGAVLVTAVGSVIIGYIILFPYIELYFSEGLYIAKHAKDEVAILSLIIVIIIIVIAKALSGKGHPLRGGLPSGHAAISFSFWISITIITENTIASMLSLATAIIIAQSRVAVRAHNKWEVLLGSLFGVVITFLLFKIFT